MIKQLDKKWKEVLFAFSGFGPNFLMVLMGAYFTDAINPAALGVNSSYQAIMTGTCFILPAVFPILYAIGKAFDGIIDIPFAHITDTLNTKWGRRRPPIAICFIPMVLSFAMCWWPIGGPNNQLLNTIWITIWALIFFSSYTMCLIAFYGSLSTTCSDEKQRLRVASYKSFFDTISYCLVYALVPVMLSGFQVTIDKFVFFCLPLMATILIPLFIIKEGKKYGYPERQNQTAERIKLFQSIKITFKNRPFRNWLIVNCCSYFGLQMFLTGMNSMIIGGMGFSGLEMMLINTSAFAPVPIMLYFFSKLKAKKGMRFTYQTCLVSFAVAILSFLFGSLFFTGGNKILQYIIGCVGGIAGSWGIAGFFTAPLHIPAQVSSVEEKLTGRNHSAMYFAAQAVCTSIIGAVASGLVYENIKMLFICKGVPGVHWAENVEKAAELFGNVDPSTVYNLGTMLIPVIVSVMCIAGFLWAFKMPKNYDAHTLAKEFKRQDPTLVLPEIAEETKKEKGEIVFVQVALSILSGFIFGFIWLGFLLKTLKNIKVEKHPILQFFLNAFVPFYSVYYLIKTNKKLKKIAEENNVKFVGHPAVDAVFGSVMFPILPINLVSLAILQQNANKLLEANYDEVVSSVR